MAATGVLTVLTPKQKVFANAMDEDEVWEEERGATNGFFQIAIIAGNGNRPLAEKVAKLVGLRSLTAANVSKFSDGEISVSITDSVRGKNVFVVQPTCPPISDRVMELLLLVSALRRASAGRITAVIPYYGYARQDRKRVARETIAAADIAKMLMALGVDHVITVDLHRGQTCGFFDTNTPVDNLDAVRSTIIPYIMSKKLYRPVILSPSETGLQRSRRFAQELLFHDVEATMAFVAPKDPATAEGFAEMTSHHRIRGVQDVALVGNVRGSDVLIVDDMIDSGSRVLVAAEMAHKAGAARIFAVCTHGVFSREIVFEKIKDSPITEVIVCDTIPPSSAAKTVPKLTYLSVAPLLAEAILRLHLHETVGSLTDQR